VGGADQERVQIGQNHHQIRALCWLSRLVLEVDLVSLKSDVNWAIRHKQRLWIAWTVDQSNAVTLQDNKWLLRDGSVARKLNLNGEFTTVSRDFVSKESLRQLPVTSLRVRLGVSQESIVVVVEALANWTLFNVGKSDAVRMAVENELFLCTVPVRRLTLIRDAEAEA